MHLRLRVVLLAVAVGVLNFACPSSPAVCGDGKLQGSEVCDDGNLTNGDGCEADCTISPPAPVCGNGTLEGDEACDDGNLVANDGCEPDCTKTPTQSICGNGKKEGVEQCDDGNTTPGDGCEPNCTSSVPGVCGDGTVNLGETCDDGNTTSGDGCEGDCKALTTTGAVLGCPGINAPVPTAGTCAVTTGDQNLLITGVILGDGVTYVGGQVLVDPAGTLTCVGCDCATQAGGAAATKLVCPKAVVSPGLINSHDHISFQGNPASSTAERYEHRNDWRKGLNGHTAINNGGNATNAQVRWAELRQVMSGTTSIVGATYTLNGNKGLLRNLDANGDAQEGLGAQATDSDTFPLGDSTGLELTSGCGYPKIPAPSVVPANASYLPHVSEGIGAAANNEFICLTQANGTGILSPRTALVHAIGLNAANIGLVAQTQSSIVWSPRSNVSLYGNTAAIPLYKKLGVRIALGTDWTISGSMNLLRELKCADSLNATRFDHALTDEELWKSVTAWSADATSTANKLGRLAPGKLADLAIYKRKGAALHRSVIDAEAADVVLTMRGGKVLFGDTPLVNAFDTQASCEGLDVCGTPKSVCVKTELAALATGTQPANTLASLTAANTSTYPLFSCTAPANEPTCVPQRGPSNVKNGSTTYTSPAAAGDQDDDGIPDSSDDCPTVFNPVRPMDNTSTVSGQADFDNDGKGDVCDPCPLDANSTTCTAFDPNDVDGDGHPNAQDNCPSVKNVSQTDSDTDGKGDDCDPCPTVPNPGLAVCPSTIYDIKQQRTPLGVPVGLGNALVTGVGASGFFLQVHENDTGYAGRDYSGVFAYAPSSGLTQGDRVDLSTVTPVTFGGQLQLNSLPALDAGLTILSSGNPMPLAVVADPQDLATNDGGLSTRLEGVLVRVDNVSVLDVNPDAGAFDKAPLNEFVVTGGLRVNDLLTLVTPFPSVGQPYASITGVLEWRNGNFKLEPRSMADLVNGPPVLTALDPASSFIREDAGVTLPRPLVVRLSNAWTSDTTVLVTASTGDVLVGDGGVIVVPANQTTAQVPLTGLTASDGGVLLTATLGTTTVTGTVRVLTATQAAHLATLTPATAAVAPGDTVHFTVGLDVPAPADVPLTVTVNPATFGAADASVTVPADQLTASFDLVVDPNAGDAGVVTVASATEQLSAQVTAQLVGAMHLVLSEVAPQGPAGAGDEFIELYNPTSAAIDISGWKLQYKSATGTTYSAKATVPANTSIPPHRYYLVASKSYGGPTADLVLTGDLQLSATAGHVRVIDDTGLEVDRLGYGAGANAGETQPFATAAPSAGSYERKALASSTAASMSTGGPDAAKGNGQDTDNNALDFVARPTREPQSLASGATEP